MIGPPDLDDLIRNANSLGAMQASAIWALVSLMLAFYIWRIQKHHADYDAQWQNIRIKEAEGDIKIADAVKSLSDVVARVNDQTTEIRFIIDERLKKQGG